MLNLNISMSTTSFLIFSGIFVVSNSSSFSQISENPNVDTSKYVYVTTTDSLVKSFFSNGFKEIDFNFINKLKDSVSEIKNIEVETYFFERIKQTKIQGLLMTSFDYGLINGYSRPQDDKPFSVFKTEGDLKITNGDLPFTLKYRYSNFKNPLGINNFFYVNFDVEQYKHIQEEKARKKLGELTGQVKDLGQLQTEIKGKIGYSEVLTQKLKEEVKAYTNSNQLYELGVQQLEKELSEMDTLSNDSLIQIKRIELESKKRVLEQRKQQVEALNQRINELDSLKNVLNTSIEKIEDYKTKIEKNKDLLTEYKSINPTGIAQQFLMSKLKKVEIGLVYPKTTSISKNSLPMKGVNLEFESGKWHTEIAGGLSMNNLFTTNDLVQNQINNQQNAFNLFDFQNITKQAWTAYVKSGYGSKTNTHAYLGVRSITPRLSDTTNQKSLVFELDLKFVPKKVKSLVFSGSLEKGNTLNKEIKTLFFEGNNWGSTFKVEKKVNRIATKISYESRFIAANYNTFNSGLTQTNCLRNEFKTNTTFSSYLNLGLNYRRDQNNVDNRLDSSLMTDLVGGNLSGAFGSIISYQFGANYLFINKELFNTKLNSENILLNASIIGQYLYNETMHALSIQYSDVLITDFNAVNRFKTFGVSYSAMGKKWKNTFSWNKMETDLSFIGWTSSDLVSNEFQWKNKKHFALLGLRMVAGSGITSAYGWKLEYKRKIKSKLELGIRAEKLVAGTYYQYFDPIRLEKFPYALGIQLNYSLE